MSLDPSHLNVVACVSTSDVPDRDMICYWCYLPLLKLEINPTRLAQPLFSVGQEEKQEPSQVIKAPSSGDDETETVLSHLDGFSVGTKSKRRGAHPPNGFEESRRRSNTCWEMNGGATLRLLLVVVL